MEQESDFLLHTHNELLKCVASLLPCSGIFVYFYLVIFVCFLCCLNKRRSTCVGCAVSCGVQGCAVLCRGALCYVLWCAGVLMDFGVQGCGLAQNSSMLQSLQRDKDEASQSVARVRARVSVVSAAARHDIDAEQRCE